MKVPILIYHHRLYCGYALYYSRVKNMKRVEKKSFLHEKDPAKKNWRVIIIKYFSRRVCITQCPTLQTRGQ